MNFMNIDVYQDNNYAHNPFYYTISSHQYIEVLEGENLAKNVGRIETWGQLYPPTNIGAC